MNNESTASANMPEFPREIYEPVLAHHIEIEGYLKQELTLSYVDLDGSHELKTCYGDILKTINALMDYTRMLDLVCEQWNLTGFHRATYEHQAGKLREIAEKFQEPLATIMLPLWKNAVKSRQRSSVWTMWGKTP